MKRHELRLENFQNWLNEGQKVLYASGNGYEGHKKLYACVGGGFEVHLDGKVVYRCTQAHDAIEKYNEL